MFIRVLFKEELSLHSYLFLPLLPSKVTNGKGAMPAWGNVLDEEEIQVGVLIGRRRCRGGHQASEDSKMIQAGRAKCGLMLGSDC